MPSATDNDTTIDDNKDNQTPSTTQTALADNADHGNDNPGVKEGDNQDNKVVDKDDEVIDFSAFDKLKEGLDPSIKVENKEKDKVNLDEKEKQQPKGKTNEKEKDSSGKVLSDGKEGEHKVVPLVDEGNKTRTTKSVDESFADLSETERGFIKQMSNPAKEFVGARLREIKTKDATIKNYEKVVAELKKNNPASLPESYYEHENGYLLSPRVAEIEGVFQRASIEKNFFLKQKENIRLGKKWNRLTIKDGKYALGEEVEPGAAAEIEVDEYLSNNARITQKLQEELEGIKSSFSAKRTERQQQDQAIEDYYFPSYKEKFYEENKYGKVIDKTLQEKGYTHSVPKGFFAKLYAAHMELREAYNELVKEKEKTKIVDGIKQTTGPSSGDIKGGGTKNAVNKEEEVIDWDAFEKAKEK